MNKLSTFYKGLLEQYGSPMNVYRATGLLVPIAGGAKGYNETADILVRTVDGVPLDDIYNEIISTLNLLNAQRNPIIERLTFPVANPFEQVSQIIGDEFEEADEFGQPKGIRLGPPWNMGFPLKYYDLGIRYTFRFLGRAPASQIRALNNSALEADQRLIFKTMLTRVFNNRTVSATLEDTGTVVNTFPFYNGDVDTLPVAPPPWKTYSHTTSHTHYLPSGGATVDSGDLDAMNDHIHHHGYAQGATLILLVNRQEAAKIAKFRVTANDQYDFLPPAGSSFLGTLVGSLPREPSDGLNTYPGFRGTYGEWNVVEEDYIPAGYMVGFASNGRFADRNPVGMREHENAALRGLKLIPQFERYPLRESFYHHAIGAGVRHPGAGVVMKITAGSYDVPALTGLAGPGGR